jgi:DNA polymerase-3 subunit delta'
MNHDNSPLGSTMRPLAPWLQNQLENLLKQRGHAWLLAGPSGLGQFELAVALASAWLCEQPNAQGACNNCGSCHAVKVHTHADLCVLLPETLALASGWPLDEKTQDDLDGKKRKPSKEIKVDAAREAVSFTQFTRARGTTKVILVFPAERMNAITANTLLKTLEEPPGAVKFILATEAAHLLLPTVRSRCLTHIMVWPGFDQALTWLEGETAFVNSATQHSPPALLTLLQRAGGRPADVLPWLEGRQMTEEAQRWQDLPKAMFRGDASALNNMSPGMAVDALQKLCHDLWTVRIGAFPRFFSPANLAAIPISSADQGYKSLSDWSKDLTCIAHTVDHPYNPGLLLEALASRAKAALSKL